MNRVPWVVAALSAFCAASCGYHVSGHANQLPKTIKSIAVPPFSNTTIRYRLTERMPAAITREFLARTRYDIIADPKDADAVLRGSIVTYNAFPTTFDPRTGRASAVMVYVHLRVTLEDRGGKVLFQRPDYEARERYEISSDPRAYLEESDAAMDRLSRDVARSLVTAILENF